ncbi:hypothetical protein WJX73_000867 [Symbiochloris irregularis]|uniref:tryptophan synthase n=1 Tax=Symbiochloris irregularis TaxID=706552 RepID=A0AAW1PI77_9CHLO
MYAVCRSLGLDAKKSATRRTVSCILRGQEEVARALRDYVGRPTPLFHAERLSEHYRQANGGRAEIAMKREDLNHTGAHNINNCIAQALLCLRMGRSRVIAETGGGQHGVAAAAVCARYDLQCCVYMGAKDMERQAQSVCQMRILGAEVCPVHTGTGTLKDATSAAMRDCISNLDTTHFMMGSVAGPHPYPMMVRDYQSIIGRETKRQCLEQFGGKPDILLACVGRGSNALGLFDEFVEDSDSLEGQVMDPHSIAAGLNYPGTGPEHSWLKDTGRADYHAPKKKIKKKNGDCACHSLPGYIVSPGA